MEKDYNILKNFFIISQITTMIYFCHLLGPVRPGRSWDQIGQHHPYFLFYVLFWGGGLYLVTAKNPASPRYDVTERDLAPPNVERQLSGTPSSPDIRRVADLPDLLLKLKSPPGPLRAWGTGSARFGNTGFSLLGSSCSSLRTHPELTP